MRAGLLVRLMVARFVLLAAHCGVKASGAERSRHSCRGAKMRRKDNRALSPCWSCTSNLGVGSVQMRQVETSFACFSIGGLRHKRRGSHAYIGMSRTPTGVRIEPRSFPTSRSRVCAIRHASGSIIALSELVG
jgi:hypothetical protein